MSKSTRNSTPEWICPKRHIVKTAWTTPEYLSDADWAFAQKVVDLVQAGAAQELHDLFRMNKELKRNFFVHTIGYIEGWSYSSEFNWLSMTLVGSLQRYTVPKLLTALAARAMEAPKS